MKKLLSIISLSSVLCMMSCTDTPQPMSATPTVDSIAASTIETVTYTYKGEELTARYRITDTSEELLPGDDNTKIAEIMAFPNSVTLIDFEDNKHFTIYENEKEADLDMNLPSRKPSALAKVGSTEQVATTEEDCSMIFFEYDKLRGDRVEYTTDNWKDFKLMDMFGWDNKTSSMLLEASTNSNTSSFKFFEHPFYAGKSFRANLNKGEREMIINLSLYLMKNIFSPTWKNQISSAICGSPE
ncbi:MAG: hypothetical protein OCC49_15020 [Fibrobacterales bacterium]